VITTESIHRSATKEPAPGVRDVSGQLAFDRLKQIIQRLFEGISQRVEAQTNIQARHQNDSALEHQRFAAAQAERQQRFDNERQVIQTEYDQVTGEIAVHFQGHYSAASEEYDETLSQINGDNRDKVEATRAEFEESRWMVISYFDENAGDSPKQIFEQFEHNQDNTREHFLSVATELESANETAIQTLKKRRMLMDLDPIRAVSMSKSSESLFESFNEAADVVRTANANIRKRKLPLLFAGLMPIVTFLAFGAGLTGLVFFAVDPSWLGFKTTPPMHEWLAILGGSAAVLTLTLQGILFAIARSRAESDHTMLVQAYINSQAARSYWETVAVKELKRRKIEFDSWFSQLVNERDSRLKMAQEKHDRLMAEYKKTQDELINQANARYPDLMESLTRQRDEKLQLAAEDYPLRLNKLESRYTWDTEKQVQEHEKNLEAVRQNHDFDWQNMARTWHAVVDAVRTSSDRLMADCAPYSQHWTDLAFGNWAPADRIPLGIRLGEFTLNLEDIENGMPENEELIPEETQFILPAVLPFPTSKSMLIEANGTEARRAAVDLLQVAMLRLLTTLPPGKIRFTIIDPIGLGENFSAFMHLADYDELMVTNRIWTETTHIEQRLTDLTEHMETVFQTYLRNEFKTIEEYNEFAGEVAEPYHILVLAGFPSNFSEQAARRLTSILSSGPRCGVYTLMSYDNQVMMPPHFDLDDVLANSTSLSCKDAHLQFDDESLAWLPLATEVPPEPEEFSRIVKRVGDESKDARRVEVSFERVVPTTLWQNDSRNGIDVPLGRAGATKLQHMRLGRGTSQHVMIAGKTGSGKSTFMHILVTNLALHYSPDEIQFYLIDFKKGVEFKTYAANKLPHARVIAIESDREFGLSVLQRLDGILKERGDLFREQGVQDIAGFRDQNPETSMPRLLLLIDEFQEFFTEDDKIGQSSSLLLDRLVRQGRAFGIHVLLGSQTLGGAYSLARSTLGQVAVRIALQCSESDAHLILSEENTAARLLTRPGEAIYNDANGLLEGNHPFQIAWLNEDRREHYLGQLNELTQERQIDVEPPIVFEGNVPADPLTNRELQSEFEGSPLGAPRTIIAWLGEAVAIKPHTEIRFRRLSGSNFLVVGQNPLGARGILSTVLFAAALQVAPIMPDEMLSASIVDPEDSPLDDDNGVAEPDTESHVEQPNARQADAQEDIDSPDASTPSDSIDAMKSFSFANMDITSPTENADSIEGDDDEIDFSAAHPGQFYILDGALIDDDEEDFWNPLADLLPHDVRVGGPRDTSAFVDEIATAIKDRGDEDKAPPIFLIIDNLGRFRDLRKQDDDYSFSSDKNKKVTPARQFVDILKNGPSVGVHTLIWCDTSNNASRWMTNQTLRELEMRAAFQMSATDSSNLIDSPAAGKLGQNRSLLFLEEHGSLEKFRPYGQPSESWIEKLREHYAPQRATLEPDLVDADADSVEEGDAIDMVDDLSSWTIL
jgi:DNA segregation ATPase FtsK/SpoIIIE, S-DNA-T family